MTDTLKHWTVTVEQDGEDLVLPLPQDLLDQAGWSTGDTLEWIDNHDGSFSLIKKVSK